MTAFRFCSPAVCVMLLLCVLFCLSACKRTGTTTYEDILAQFRAQLTEKTEVPADDPIAAALSDIAARCGNPAVMAYSLHDINGDGTDELILTETDASTIHAIFTQNGEEAVLLEQFEKGCIIKPDGCLYYIKNIESGKTYHVVYLVDGALVGSVHGFTEEEGGDPVPFRLEDGVRIPITTEEYSELFSAHQMWFFESNTLETGLFAIPLFPAEDTSAAPMISVTTYDEVLALCREIMEVHIPRAKEYKDSGISFRTLYSFPDARSYALYNQLYPRLSSTATINYLFYNAGDAGYALFDMNGDGTDELILLSEDYAVLAILTLRDGLPVVLTTTVNTVNAKGQFDATRYASDNKNAVQNCLWDISEDGSLRSLICVQYEYNQTAQAYYTHSVDRGRKTEITDEEYRTLAAEADLCEDGYSAREYTRAHAGFVFQPLLPEKHSPVLDTSRAFRRDPYLISETQTFTQTGEDSWETEFQFLSPTDENTFAHIPLNTSITLEDSVYYFDSAVIRGHIEPITNGFWLIPEEVTDSSIVNKPYLYIYKQD